MTRATYRQVLQTTGLAFCATPGLGVNAAAATHAVGAAALDVETKRSSVARLPEQRSGSAEQSPAGSG